MNKRQKKKAYKKKHGHNPPNYGKQIRTVFKRLGATFESFSRDLEKVTCSLGKLRKALKEKEVNRIE